MPTTISSTVCKIGVYFAVCIWLMSQGRGLCGLRCTWCQCAARSVQDKTVIPCSRCKNKTYRLVETGTDSSSGSSVKTDGALSVGSLTTRVGMGWAGGGAGTSSGTNGAGVGPRADSVPSAEMTSPESGDGPFGRAGAGSGDKAAASQMGDSGIGLGVDTAG